MTAQIGVMNRLAVALAADSAVSLGRDADKIYTSADKLFQLSSYAPVGIMVYGNADFLKLPWEAIVKAYRRFLSRTRYESVAEYADSFFSFLKENEEMFPKEQQDRRCLDLAVALLADIRDALERELDEKAKPPSGLTHDDIKEIAKKHIEIRLKTIKSQDTVQGIDRTRKRHIREHFKDQITEVIKVVFGELPLHPKTKRDIRSAVLEMLTRTYFGPFNCGVVITGFGEKEYMPTLLSYEVEEMVSGHIRMCPVHNQQISRQNTAAIVPFAQQEMVHSFLRGIDPDLYKHITESTECTLSGLLQTVTERISEDVGKVPKNIEEKIRAEASRSIGKLFEDWAQCCEQHWRPVLEIASSLPKDELGTMAEALVNLTKFRRRVTPERETVGGPIDVAVITKGDGFVWVQRKHYFDAKLNPRVIAHYSQG